MFEVEIDTRNLQSVFDRLARAAANPAPLMRDIADIMWDAVEENFAQEGRPRWLGLKPPGRPGGKILQKSGRLAASITPSSDATSAKVGTNLKYAAIHQFGGQTRPHLIVARNAKALRFNGRFAKSVKHPGSKIPARPYLSLMPDDIAEIEQTAADYLRRVID